MNMTDEMKQTLLIHNYLFVQRQYSELHVQTIVKSTRYSNSL